MSYLRTRHSMVTRVDWIARVKCVPLGLRVFPPWWTVSSVSSWDTPQLVFLESDSYWTRNPWTCLTSCITFYRSLDQKYSYIPGLSGKHHWVNRGMHRIVDDLLSKTTRTLPYTWRQYSWMTRSNPITSPCCQSSTYLRLCVFRKP